MLEELMQYLSMTTPSSSSSEQVCKQHRQAVLRRIRGRHRLVPEPLAKTTALNVHAQQPSNDSETSACDCDKASSASADRSSEPSKEGDKCNASLGLSVASPNAPVRPEPHSPDLAIICRKARKTDAQSETWFGNSITLPPAEFVCLSQGGLVVLGDVLPIWAGLTVEGVCASRLISTAEAMPWVPCCVTVQVGPRSSPPKVPVKHCFLPS